MTKKVVSEDSGMLVPFTHSELVEKAGIWVSKRFEITIKEKCCGWEIPDVVGLNLGKSIMVECKVSRSDFHADKHKFSRNTKLGDKMLGNYRLYCCPQGMLNEKDLPEKWGLLEVYPSGFLKLRKDIFDMAHWFNLESDGYRQERHLLFTAIRDESTQKNKIIKNFKW